MKSKRALRECIIRTLIFGALPVGVFGTDVLKTTGFTTCLDNSTITVTNLNVAYDRAAGVVTFDVAGTSSKQQNVTAALTVTAYGKQVYEKTFNPCDTDTKVDQLCPGKVLRVWAHNYFILIKLLSSGGSLRSKGQPIHTIQY